MSRQEAQCDMWVATNQPERLMPAKREGSLSRSSQSPSIAAVGRGWRSGLISAGQVPRSSSMIEFSSEPREQSPSFNPGQTKADT
jgi:hypothetical protein